MGERIRIPAEDELVDRLAWSERLLTAKRWERAAIVFAYTEVGEVGAGRWHKPAPPKMHVREFARQGYAGLSTNKSVDRYRRAWVTAISNGWAVPVEPGQTVELPEHPFPAWPFGDNEPPVPTPEATAEAIRQGNAETARAARRALRDRRHHQRAHRKRRTDVELVFEHLGTAEDEIRKAAAYVARIETDDLLRGKILAFVGDIEKVTRDITRRLQPDGATVRVMRE